MSYVELLEVSYFGVWVVEVEVLSLHRALTPAAYLLSWLRGPSFRHRCCHPGFEGTRWMGTFPRRAAGLAPSLFSSRLCL